MLFSRSRRKRRRVSRSNSATPNTTFLFDGNAPLVEKQGSTTTATYTYGNSLLRKDSEFPLFDGQGSERTVTNVSQSVQGSISYDAFGQPNASSGSSTSAYMFGATSGYRSDGDSGLILVGCRYYDPQVGRFVTRDTYLDQHPYLYCNGDPVNHLDPTGHDDIWNWLDIFNEGVFCGLGGIIGSGGGPIGILGGAGLGAVCGHSFTIGEKRLCKALGDLGDTIRNGQGAVGSGDGSNNGSHGRPPGGGGNLYD